jgi:hypothetical protein
VRTIVGTTFGVPTFLLVGICVACLGWKRHGGWASKGEDPMIGLSGILQQFSYKQLSLATGAFKEESKLGKGGFGSVYWGVLPATSIWASSGSEEDH